MCLLQTVKMKLLVILLIFHVAFAAGAFRPADIVRFQRAVEKCRISEDVSDEVLERVLNGEIVDDPHFNCFAACLLEEFQLLKPDGSFNDELAVTKIPQDADFAQQLTDAIKTCSARRDPDKCTTAHLLFVCMYENNIPTLLFG
ncbi:general odorant-binding protein 56d-like [Diachasmimorpha longicaudata]|uniref:general odorant-binding protein 56d-like n=1 Tax=Diachasmimorpha longicaudata TaxID=58733 RepID=UPI0030B8E1D2